MGLDPFRGALPWWFLKQFSGGKALIVLPEEEDVLSLVDDMRALFKIPAGWLPAKIPPSLGIAGYSAEEEPARQAALYEWLFGRNSVLVASPEGLRLPVDPPEDLRQRSLQLKPGLTLPRRGFEDLLTAAGYSRNERAEQVGEYAIRGDVTDIWPPEQEAPLRVIWNLDTIEAIRVIDLHTQRSDEYQREVIIYPVLAGQETTLKDISSKSPEIQTYYFEGAEGRTGAEGESATPPSRAFRPSAPSNSFEPPPSFSGHAELLRNQLIRWHEDDWKVAVFCHNRGERDRLEELLEDRMASARGVRPPWMPLMVIGELEHGFLEPGARLAVLANAEIFGRYRRRIRLPKFEGGGALSSPLDVKPNDYLVHERYGVGRYIGLKPIRVGRVASEFLAIEYKGGDKIYVPIFEIQQVQKYLGAEGRRPALSSLDTAAWERVTSRVREDVAKLAADLLRRAAQRSLRPGHAHPPRTHLEEEFAESFIYPLTPDQVKTLEEVEADMMAPKAMDRLICGDVGFGKTEIAMRAALKCALTAKQAALLCPTTILAEQHWRNFSERMADYPVTVKLLSRFQEKAEQKKIIENLNKGAVDIVIGTHRLLSTDVRFHDLGLLIIDEEHRFGVKQKNKLLGLRETVDVLSLTATPIPRTLASSLGGIKDLSVIETAPEGRLPISTHVGLFSEDLVVKAVQQEMDRGGQVFYVHNRVKTMEAREAWLKKILPQCRIGAAHGQMNEAELEKVMHDFLHQKIDVLLATTIIASGLDIPSVNTLIVEEAEEMGLAQLYQLRGRVGRSRARAFCYLFYDSRNMTTDAKKRLEALKEYTALGSGFRLAMRDMEIRGAGNLLGPEQHGNMAAVGIETYSRLLNDEIQKLKGEAAEDLAQGPLLELSLSAYLPEDYLPAESERVHMYKRILSADENQLMKLKEELVDRCGPLPPAAKTLLDAAALRLAAKEKGVSEVHQESEALLVYFRPSFKLPEKSLDLLLGQKVSVLAFIPASADKAGKPGVRLYFVKDENPLDALGRFLRLIFPV